MLKSRFLKFLKKFNVCCNPGNLFNVIDLFLMIKRMKTETKKTGISGAQYAELDIIEKAMQKLALLKKVKKKETQ